MGWYSDWIVEFRCNENGESIEDLWDQDEVDKALQGELASAFYSGNGNEAEFNVNNGDDCPGLAKLWELYKCPMRIHCINNGGHNEISMDPYFYPSEFEWEFDSEIEEMIIILCEKENIKMSYDEDSYTRENRYENLAKTIINTHYTNQ